MPFQANSRRDAHATIAGFFYQVNITLLRWLGLQPGQHLELECGEDIDTVDTPGDEPGLAEQRLLEQLKVRSNRSLTLRSPEALEALSNFCDHRSSNPHSLLQFRYLTTAGSGVELGWALPENGVEIWMALHRGEYDDDFRVSALREIRRILKLGKRPQRVPKRAWNALQQVLDATDDEVLGNLIFTFEWALAYGDPNQSEADVLSTLVSQGRGVSNAEAAQVYKHLFAFVFRLLTRPGAKILTTATLADELSAPSIPSNQRGILNVIKEEIEILKQEVGAIKKGLALRDAEVNALKQTVEQIARSYGFQNVFSLSAATLSTDVPELVMPRASRVALVDSLLAQVETNGAALLLGEPGSGKTQLLRLAIDKTSRHTTWLNIPRGATEAQANLLIDALVRSLSPEAKGSSLRDRYTSAMSNFTDAVVVIEDLPRLLPGGPLAAQLETLATCLKNAHSVLLLSSYYQLPASTGKGLGKTKFDVPRLTEEDVEDILRSAGAPQNFRKEAISRVLVAVSGGLPVLAMAAVRYLSDRNWAFSVPEVELLVHVEFAADVRNDAGTLLQATIPDVEERELLIRMSLAIGSFTREDIALVAKVPKVIALPGEKVNRAIGLWLQDTGSARFLLSPLLTSNLGAALDPNTRMAVHYVLALRILARTSLNPFDIVTCVHHLRMAEDMAFACIVLIQAHAAILEMDGTPHDDFGLMRIPVATVLASDVDLNLRLYLSSLDIIVRLKQGREIDSMISRMDRLLTAADHQGWGTVLAAGALAIHLVWKQPTTANRFLLLAMAGARTARLPNGSPLPVGNYPLEGLLWMSAYSAKSDEEADSCLETITRFTPEQIEVLSASELAEDNVTILCDGYWRREYLKPEAKRNWNHVAIKLDGVDRTARAIEFDLLEAASIRTRIMLLAEWQHLLDDAVTLAASSLERFASDDCRFLILEVTGRQLRYRGKREQAIEWLGRALSCKGYEKSLWRRNVLITLADLYSKFEPKKAEEFTASAVDMAKGGVLIEPIFIETLLEHVIALWNAGEEQKASEVFADVLNRLFAIREDTDSWKGLFYRTFHLLSYFSDIAQHGKESSTYPPPEQGLLLASNEVAHTLYKPEQQSYIWFRQAMLADGVGDLQRAARATWKVLEYANEAPAFWANAPLVSVYGVAATLLANDFEGATKLALTLTYSEPQEIARRLEEKGLSNQAAEFRRMQESAPTEAQKSALRVNPWVPMAIRLAYLQLHGRPEVETASSIADIERIMPAEKQSEALGRALRESFLEGTTWDTLQQEGYDAMRVGQYARALILLVGAMQKAPVVQSLYLQTYLAQNLEGWLGTTKSIYREIVAPLFRAYWEHTLATSTAFRTGTSYTARQFELIDGTPNGTRKFLGRMRFCIGATLPEETMSWLNRA